MDEILIENKKYVSSKQAAKLTGYAKDYVGQLCREGRVPARLVGRSWYVLESAIKDHRFGEQPSPDEDAKTAATRPTEATHEAEEGSPEATPIGFQKSSYVSPRYAADAVETLPSLNLLAQTKSSSHEEAEKLSKEPENLYSTSDSDGADSHQALHDSWSQWFGTDADEPELPVGEVTQPSEPREEEAVLPGTEEEEEVTIPLHHLSTARDLPQRDLLPQKQPNIRRMPIVGGFDVAQAPLRPKEKGSMSHARTQGRPNRVLRFVFLVLALATACFTTLETGYLDKYLVSDSRGNVLSGVSVYNK